MPLKRLQKIRTQFIGWYIAVFFVSYALLFAIARFSLSASLLKQDHDFVSSILTEYSRRYKIEGREEAIQEIELEKNGDLYRQTVTRLADPNNQTLYISAPLNWHRYRLIDLSNRAPTTPDGWFTLPKPNDEDLFEVKSTVLDDGNVLQVGIDSGQRNDSIDSFTHLFLTGTALVIVIGVISSILLVARWLRPIQHLTNTVRSISETGQINARVKLRGSHDELDELGALFNQMLVRIEALINGMRESLDNIAHDLRTPMTRLRGAAEHALQAQNPHEICQEALADCLEQSDQVVTMLQTLTDISEAETGVVKLNLEPVNLSEVLEEVIDVYRYVADDKNITIACACDKDIVIEADRNRLKQVIGNLLDNGIKYTAENGRVDMSAASDGQQVALTIRDNGIGIPGYELGRIWDRLYRGDQSRSQKGLGLGLSLVKAIVNAHQGHISVESTVGQGSTFSLELPLKQHAL